MLRIRKFGENRSGYNAALWNFHSFCAATPESVFAKVVQIKTSTLPEAYSHQSDNVRFERDFAFNNWGQRNFDRIELRRRSRRKT